MTAASTATTGQLDVPGARLHYEVRGAGPLLVLVGAPMDAAAFAPLADLLATDHTVLTTDPRGVHRSPMTDPNQDSTPEQRADDLARLIDHVDAGPATVFGSSGGAVSALALAQHHPDRVHTVIAHEPPLATLVDDRDRLLAETDALCAVYFDGDVIGAWKRFFAQANLQLPPGAAEEMFGGERDPQAVADERHWFAHEMRPTVRWSPDLDALRAGPVRIVAGIGEDSTDQLCDRTTQALATALGIEPTYFPGGHIAFAEDPARFVAPLRGVLS